MKQSKANKFNASLLIAIVSLAVSIIALGHTFWQSWKQEKEELIIRVAPNVEGFPIKLSSIDLGKEGHVIYLPFKMNVTNSGHKTLSIIEHRIFQLVGEGPIEQNKKYYTGIDGGLFNLNGTKAKIPITISQGETIAYIVYVGVLVKTDVMETLKSYNGKTLSRRTMYKILGRDGMDIYGNTVDYHENKDGSFSFGVKDSSSNIPIFVFQWKTGKGNKFVSLGGDYIFSEY
ncbi:MAG: hypothetical protein ACMUJM_26175 [bacterium]